MAAQTRPHVLKLYKQIMQMGKTWTAKSGKPGDTKKERDFIKTEAQTLFKKNKGLSDAKVINDCIHEGQARLELAVHYKTPYPRPVNMPPHAMAKKMGKEQGRVQERLKKQSIPTYIRSHFDR